MFSHSLPEKCFTDEITSWKNHPTYLRFFLLWPSRGPALCFSALGCGLSPSQEESASAGPGPEAHAKFTCPVEKEWDGRGAKASQLFLCWQHVSTEGNSWITLGTCHLLGSYYFHHLFKKYFIYLFLKRGEGKEEERKRNSEKERRKLASSHSPPTGDLARNPDVHWLGIEPATFGLQAGSTQSSEPYQPGLFSPFLKVRMYIYSSLFKTKKKDLRQL